MSEITDAAWFYSSLAQVSASIFGIIGAVFATRLTDYIRDTHRVRDDIQRSIDDCHGNLLHHAGVITSKEHYNSVGVPVDRAALDHAAALFRGLAGRVSEESLQTLIDELKTNQQDVTVPFAVDHLKQYVPWLEALQPRIRAFRTMAFPRSLWAMWCLLAWLTVVGVIWPMLALPGISRGSVFLSKPLILALFGVGALAFIGFLLRELVTLWGLTKSFQWLER